MRWPAARDKGFSSVCGNHSCCTSWLGCPSQVCTTFQGATLKMRVKEVCPFCEEFFVLDRKMAFVDDGPTAEPGR